MSRLSFSDRWVVVTGASSGLGRAIAWRLATSENARVIAVARREDRLRELCSQLRDAGGQAEAVPADLAAPGGAAQVIASATQIAGGAPFALVNNAGVTWYGHFDRMPEEEITRIINLNIRGTLALTRLFVAARQSHGSSLSRPQPEHRRSPGIRAAVLTVTSLAAHVPVPYQAVYAASKHALQAFSESLAMELRADGFVITTVEPGGIETEMIAASGLDGRFSRRALASADTVAAAAVRSWKRKRLRCVPGGSNKLVAIAGRCLPVRMVASASERLFRP